MKHLKTTNDASTRRIFFQQGKPNEGGGVPPENPRQEAVIKLGVYKAREIISQAEYDELASLIRGLPETHKADIQFLEFIAWQPEASITKIVSSIRVITRLSSVLGGDLEAEETSFVDLFYAAVQRAYQEEKNQK